MCKAVVVGSLNLDTSITLERMPQPGETIAAQGISLNPGGKGANQAFALGRLGCPVAMVGAVGQDAAGDTLLESLQAAGVDCSCVARREVPTGQAFITVDSAGENAIIILAGANSTVSPADVEKLRPQHPIIDLILEYRQLTKLNSTYVEGLAKVIAPDGRIHTSFQNTVTATGRLSSTEPNLQNIPVRTPIGRELRKFFAGSGGNLLVDADYSQIELRVLAHVADDAAMKEDFLEGRDIHTATAARVFQMPVDMVTKDMRSKAKAVNFGIVYGIGAFSLSKDIGVTRKEADDYIKEYLRNYAGVDAYMKRVVEEAKEKGYVETLFGRRRYLPELKSGNFNLRAFGERVARNMPIQGAAADIIKIAMIRVSSRLAREGLQGKLILQVHDELIVECPPEEREQVERILQEEMEGAVRLSVPMVAEAGSGRTWFEAKE